MSKTTDSSSVTPKQAIIRRLPRLGLSSSIKQAAQRRGVEGRDLAALHSLVDRHIESIRDGVCELLAGRTSPPAASRQTGPPASSPPTASADPAKG